MCGGRVQMVIVMSVGYGRGMHSVGYGMVGQEVGGMNYR